MVSMKINKSEGEMPLTKDEYGYGLRVSLNAEQTKALGITELIKPGTSVHLNAMSFVDRSEKSVDSDSDNDGNIPDLTLTLQITDLEFNYDDGRSSIQKLYEKSGMNP